MSKVAASASDAGVGLDKILAILGVTQDRTQQAAETIGRAWNTILQRMNKISAGKDVSDTGASLNFWGITINVMKTLSNDYSEMSMLENPVGRATRRKIVS